MIKQSERFSYKGSKTREISFPLGGIGSGSIGLAGNGRLIDWEIFNRPNKGSINGLSHFAIKAEQNGKVLDVRALNSDLQANFAGQYTKQKYNPVEGFGHGAERGTLAGVPHFKDAEFIGEFPIVEVKFIDDSFPGKVSIEAFNPFIPLNDKDSSIPGAFFDICLENILQEEIIYTVCLSLSNPFEPSTHLHKYIQKDRLHSIKMSSTKHQSDAPEYGDISISTDAEEISYQEYWYRGSWFDNLEIFWREFSTPGRLLQRSYTDAGEAHTFDVGSMAAHVTLKPGEKKHLHFVITWNFPNNSDYWNVDLKMNQQDKLNTWKNYYATLFKDSVQSAVYSLENWDRLYNQTMDFKNALFSSTLPKDALEAVSANLAVLKSPTVLRLQDGSFYGWEGCNATTGSCFGSCTHVWNYAYALPFLFPALERSMRDLDYKYNLQENGKMTFRIMLPLGREPWNFRACVDGQFGGVIKAYRDWKISGDTNWLRSNWDAIKKSLEYAWAESNEDRWDIEKTGILTGRQHHTLDMELFGPNSWLMGFYLGALKAASEMAEFLGEPEKASEYRSLFENGREWADENLFNGEYYQQIVDLKDKKLLEKYSTGDAILGISTEQAYWNQEKKEIKYQIGDGCEIDQVVAQWHANLCGLGDIFDRDQVHSALQALYKNNFKSEMRKVFNPCRVFSMNDEGGLIICEWPEGKYRPAVPLTYAQETMTGFEYQAAAHMIQEGLIDEGMEIVKAIRKRYDGERRNPWNEIECGSNYARSMASYSLINAFSGFEFDMVKGMIGFNPSKIAGEVFQCFWSLDSGWGTFTTTGKISEIKVLYGCLNIVMINLPYINNTEVKHVILNGMNVNYLRNEKGLLFDDLIKIHSHETLFIEVV